MKRKIKSYYQITIIKINKRIKLMKYINTVKLNVL